MNRSSTVWRNGRLARETGTPPERRRRSRRSGSAELRERRDRARRGSFAELQWDLGGLVYEMAARDHFRLDVVVRQAARLQEVDAELAEVERLLRLDEAAAAGSCPACGALYARGASSAGSAERIS